MRNLDENDPIVNAITEEAVHLARAAAAEARSSRLARGKQIRLALAMMILTPLALYLNETARHEVRHASKGAAEHSNSSAMSVNNSYFGVQPEEAVGSPTLLVQSAGEREKELLTELPEVPLLIVRNENGQVTSVHVLER
jgi:hypothetical protein